MSKFKRIYRRVTTTERIVVHHHGDGTGAETVAELFFADAKVEPMEAELALDTPLQLTTGTTEKKTKDGTNE